MDSYGLRSNDPSDIETARCIAEAMGQADREQEMEKQGGGDQQEQQQQETQQQYHHVGR